MTSAAPHAGDERGAVDLSALAATAAGSPAQPGQSGQSWVVEVTDETFDQVAQQSLQYPVVLELYSPRDQQGPQVSRALADHTNANQGRWLLGRVNVDTSPRIAQAVQATAVPYVLVLLAGQAAPLFQGTRPAAEITAALDQVAQVALANGMSGRAPAQGGAPATTPDSPAEPVVDPKYAPAYDAMEQGDYAAALAEFDKLLTQTPNDTEAQSGRAQAALLARSLDVDTEKVMAAAEADPTDVEAQLAAADLEAIFGRYPEAFDRLIGLIGTLRGEDREPVRVRVLELFQTLPAGDPVVTRARRALSTALFT
ncbi:tetratricopeptide repeat protein [Aestuariimicrobium sp. Y1814]|uniref:tetratricopeptide repeat protein n=1 Tax=Aestuariimicrobium sp. Y1814 TaxID=3418742 RepID=UPI003DA77D2A